MQTQEVGRVGRISAPTRRRYRAYMELGDHYLSSGQLLEAQQCYRDAALLCRYASDAYVGVGVSALRRDSLDEAENAFRVAVRLDPMCGRALNGLGMVAERRGRFRRAYELYARSLDHDPGNAEALLGLFQTACRTGRLEDAVGRFEQSAEAAGADEVVRFVLATLYHQLGREQDARGILRALVVDSPSYTCAADLLEEVELCLAGHSPGP